jgi:hypothetical protein
VPEAFSQGARKGGEIRRGAREGETSEEYFWGATWPGGRVTRSFSSCIESLAMARFICPHRHPVLPLSSYRRCIFIANNLVRQGDVHW